MATGVSSGKLKPSYPKDIHPRLNALLESALNVEAGERPTFEAIVLEMSDIITELKEKVRPLRQDPEERVTRHSPRDLLGVCFESDDMMHGSLSRSTILLIRVSSTFTLTLCTKQLRQDRVRSRDVVERVWQFDDGEGSIMSQQIRPLIAYTGNQLKSCIP